MCELLGEIIGETVRIGCMVNGAIGGELMRAGGVAVPIELTKLAAEDPPKSSSFIKSPKPTGLLGRADPGGGARNGKLALLLPVFDTLGGGSSDGGTGEGGAGQRWPLLVDASFIRFSVRLWSSEARLA